MIHTPLAIDVIMHHREFYRPSSTGHLVTRVMADAKQHVWRRERQMTAAEIQQPERELWILHPVGETHPLSVPPESVQIVLLDGSWSETSAIAREIGSWGRLVNLPMTGTSRFWLRAQQDGGRFSTAEALLSLLEGMGLNAAHTALRRQLELHVYAHLRTRGRKDLAELFLEESPLKQAFPEMLARLNERRPRLD